VAVWQYRREKVNGGEGRMEREKRGSRGQVGKEKRGLSEEGGSGRGEGVGEGQKRSSLRLSCRYLRRGKG